MQKRKPHPNIEVRADAASLLVAAFDVFPSIAEKYLRKLGFSRAEDVAGLQPGTTYIPLDVWLATFDAVLREIGPNALFKFGQRGIENPNLPRAARSLEETLRHLDIAYHMSHRKGGVSMYNPATKRMMEGIGHYVVQSVSADKRIRVRVDTPYPCPAEHGLLAALAAQYEPRTVVSHEEGDCRLRSDSESCTYLFAR